MTAEQMIGLGLALLVMACGLIGSVLPALPGTPLVLAAAVIHRLYFHAASVSNLVLVVLVLLTVLSVVLDYLAGVFGAKKLGATWRGMVGAVVGGLAGLFLGLPGIILGPFFGALLFELIGGYGFKQATRAGLGTLLGLAAGALGKFIISVIMIGLFAANVVFRTWQ